MTAARDMRKVNSGAMTRSEVAGDVVKEALRTIALGNLTEEEKTDYTLILKGHIALATAVFPAHSGAQLDVLARLPIWKQHMNYLHGTGHGVGHFPSMYTKRTAEHPNERESHSIQLKTIFLNHFNYYYWVIIWDL